MAQTALNALIESDSRKTIGGSFFEVQMITRIFFLIASVSVSANAYGIPLATSLSHDVSIQRSLGVLNQNRADFCHSSALTRINLPVWPSPTSPRFDYAFQLIGNRDSSAPTVIVLPGGPGGGAIAPWGPSLSVVFNLPTSGTNAILTDPRGRGCNATISANDETVSTALVAGDVVGMISSLQLKNYVLYGHSYGGQLATVVADQATRAGWPPRGIVLSATRGRYNFEHESPYDGFIQEWEQFKKYLPKNVVSRLSTMPLPLNISSEKWAAYILNGLQEGTVFRGGRAFNQMREQILALETGNPIQIEKLRAAVEASVVGGDPRSDFWRINRAIVCRENWSENNGPTPDQLLNGRIVWFKNPRFCQGLKLDRRFDSKDFQISVPVFYFHGSRDANVPIWQGHYHFQNQRNSPVKRFVLIDQVAHGLPMGGLSSCRDLIWKAVFNSGKGLEHAVTACNMPTRIF